jgi:hypothetical protein
MLVVLLLLSITLGWPIFGATTAMPEQASGPPTDSDARRM